jgi:hypothetical protein
MPPVIGYLRRLRRHGGGGPVDPDYGVDEGEVPVDPEWGVDEGAGVGGGPIVPPSHKPLPKPPPGIWPPPTEIWPPVALPPDFPMPPGSIWPPVGGTKPLPRPPGSPGSPDQGLPGAPPTAGQLPSGGRPTRPDQGLPSQKFLVAIVAVGAGGPRVIGYTVVDPSLSPGHELPEPPTAQPK